jgi:hypothetical protein
MPGIKELSFHWRNGGLEAWLDVECHSLLSWNIMMADGTPEDYKLRDDPFCIWDPRVRLSGVQPVYTWCYRPNTRERLHRVYLDDQYVEVKAEVVRRAKEFLGIESSTSNN